MSTLDPSIACERLIQKLRDKGITDERVLDAFRKVPRHLFIQGTTPEFAYEDTTFPIGQGQTISQPYIVALMTQLLELGKDQKILEIGTGSGFQAAVLAQFSRRVYTIERHNDLGDRARKLLRNMGLANVTFKIGDGTCGWKQWSPFDRIIVTAGAPVTPETLAEQLAVGGIMIIPTGDRAEQELMLYRKTESGLESKSVEKVVFVPLIGQHGWKE
ncbi:MAG: protein-L-isoaspartate(D-aspartate) O-methyltransferase [Chitinispirillia bacterium]|nr:protein-L-isoaspartate(D-aspartate) O-methyltransferase [Chitinispirillia bacterium]MCL2269591.1 protein-L-isoaspartate(D-aspartate) O-methyltransferase [Chitinispirillia bacterium]